MLRVVHPTGKAMCISSDNFILLIFIIHIHVHITLTALLCLQIFPIASQIAANNLKKKQLRFGYYTEPKKYYESG